MPFIMCFQGPPGAEPLNHTPLPHVNSLSSKLIDGKLSYYSLAPERMVYASTRNDKAEKIQAERQKVTESLEKNFRA
jgi:hypothetical protein